MGILNKACKCNYWRQGQHYSTVFLHIPTHCSLLSDTDIEPGRGQPGNTEVDQTNES